MLLTFAALIAVLMLVVLLLPKAKRGECDLCGKRVHPDETRCDECADFARTAP